ncbi:MAG: LytTR family DNA-binding domain-containing protein [Xanthomonadales bacterium]|nr:LytTR family DNA-binding domain-containing protein [Xanthomonadales bacterium]
MILRVHIVDDEPHARQRLRQLLAARDDVQVLAESASGAEAVAACRAQPVDVVLLDIRMPGMDGLATAQALARLRPAPAVIFLTAADDRAIEAFEAGAADYLLKPVRGERLAAALDRARRLVRSAATTATQTVPPARRHFVERRLGEMFLIPVDTVLALRAEDKYVCLVTATGEHLIEESLVAVEREFGRAFLRIHRNCLVAAGQVRALERIGERDHVRVAGMDEPLEVSRRNLPAVREHLLALADPTLVVKD